MEIVIQCAVLLRFGKHGNRALIVSRAGCLVDGWTIGQTLPEQESDQLVIRGMIVEDAACIFPDIFQAGSIAPKEIASFSNCSISTVSNSRRLSPK